MNLILDLILNLILDLILNLILNLNFHLTLDLILNLILKNKPIQTCMISYSLVNALYVQGFISHCAGILIDQAISLSITTVKYPKVKPNQIHLDLLQ